MSQVVIYHNPRCSKSRETLKLLQEHGIEPKVVEYLEQRLSKAKLKSLLKMLGLKPAELIRTKEATYKDLGLNANSSDNDCLEAMAQYPKLIERPIVVSGQKAVIGRPPSNVLEICSV